MSGFRVPGEIGGGGNKYRSTSATSLPRSPTGIEPSYLPERKLGTSTRYLSSSVETLQFLPVYSHMLFKYNASK